MSNPPRSIPIALRVLSVLWCAAAAYLLYGVYGNWVIIQHYAPEIAKDPELGREFYRQAVFFGITGVLGLVAAFGMFFSPRKLVWWLALLLCPGTGWWFASELPHLLLSGASQGLLIFLSLVALYALTFVYLLLPSVRAAFDIGQRPTMRSSELPPAGAAGSRSP